MQPVPAPCAPGEKAMVQVPLVRLQHAPAGQGAAHVEPVLPAAPQQATVVLISVHAVPTQQVLAGLQGL